MRALHVVDDQSERERTLDYISGVEMAATYYTAIETFFPLSLQ